MHLSNCHYLSYPFPNKPRFSYFCSSRKHSGQRRNFSFSHSVFLPVWRMENFLLFSSKLRLSSTNAFSLEEAEIFCLGKGQAWTGHSREIHCLQGAISWQEAWEGGIITFSESSSLTFNSVNID